MEARMPDVYRRAAPAYRGLSGVEEYLQQRLPRDLLELVRLRVSQINGCSVCAHMHSHGARGAGVTDERLWSAATWRDAPFYTDRERAALALAEAATRIADHPEGVPDEIWHSAATYFDEDELAALVVAIATINTWNRINVTTRLVAGPTH